MRRAVRLYPVWEKRMETAKDAEAAVPAAPEYSRAEVHGRAFDGGGPRAGSAAAVSALPPGPDLEGWLWTDES
jgi:hypothetical protein